MQLTIIRLAYGREAFQLFKPVRHGFERSRIRQVGEDECEDSGGFAGHGLVHIPRVGQVHFLDHGLKARLVVKGA